MSCLVPGKFLAGHCACGFSISNLTATVLLQAKPHSVHHLKRASSWSICLQLVPSTTKPFFIISHFFSWLAINHPPHTHTLSQPHTYTYTPMHTYLYTPLYYPVGFGGRIHRLLFSRGVRPLQLVPYLWN